MSDIAIILNGISVGELSLTGIAPTISGASVELIISPSILNLEGQLITVSGVSTELIISYGELSITGSDVDVTLGDMLAIPIAALEIEGIAPEVYYEIPITSAETGMVGINPTLEGDLSVEFVIVPANITINGNAEDIIVHVHSQTYLYIPSSEITFSGNTITIEYSLAVPISEIDISGINNITPTVTLLSEVSPTLPKFECELFSGAKIDTVLPEFSMYSNIYSGHNADFISSLSPLYFEANSGSYILDTLPSISIVINASNNILGDLSSFLPELIFSITAIDNSAGNIELDLPKFVFTSNSITGITGNFIFNIPKFNFTSNLLQGFTGDIEGSFRILNFKAEAFPSDDAEITMILPWIEFLISSGEITSAVLRYIKDRIA